MNLLTSFRSELLKTKRTATWYLGIAITVIVPALLSIDYYNQPATEKRGLVNPWQAYESNAFMISGILMLPLFILLVCTLFPQIEYRNNTWKQVLASPQSRFNIFTARFLHVLLMIALYLVAFDTFVVAFGYVIDLFSPAYGFSKFPVLWEQLLRLTALSFGSVLGLTAILFWVGLRFKNFFIPIATGFVLWISVIFAFEVRLPIADWHPFSYPIFATIGRYSERVPDVLGRSAVYCFVFLILGFLDFRVKRVKE